MGGPGFQPTQPLGLFQAMVMVVWVFCSIQTLPMAIGLVFFFSSAL